MLAPGLKETSLGSPQDTPLPNAHNSLSINTRIRAQIAERRQKHLSPALLTGKKAVQPQPQTPQLDWSTGWTGKTKGEKVCRNSRQWDVPPQPSYEHLFQRTAVFYKADLKIGIFLLLRELVHFIFLLAKLLLVFYILASPAEPPQRWGGEAESILA